MKKDDIIFVAENCGLSYQGDNEDGEPEFLGTQKMWDLFKSKNVSNETVDRVDLDLQELKDMQYLLKYV